MKPIVPLLCLLGFISGRLPAADKPAAAPLPLARPEDEGLSVARLERLHAFMRQEIAAGDYLGAVTLVVRHGKIVEWNAYGSRDLAKNSPLQRDSIFRIYSMTKTVTSVAVLILMEEGRLTLDEPVADFLPEFKNMQVFAGGTADAPVLRPAARPITIRQLLTHTAGFATGAKDPAEAVKLYNRFDLHQCADFTDYCARLSRLPLGAEPGERFSYDGVNLEVLSCLIEVVSGRPFADFLQTRLFDPLGLKDTGFSVPPEKRSRIADICTNDTPGHLVLAPEKTATHPGEPLNAYSSGAGGLYSTAGDYARFSQMLLNGGELDGISVLGRKTVDLMMQNHLTHLDPPVTEFSDAEGFGLGGSVVLDVARRGLLGSPGQFGWSGAGSTYYTIDRQEQLVAILMMQHLPSSQHKISGRFYNLVYQSLVK